MDFKKITTQNKTKIIATIGPATVASDKILQEFIQDTDIFRLNFKHNTPQWHIQTILKTQELAAQMEVLGPAIMLDLQGPSIRVVLAKDSIQIKKDELYEVVDDPKNDKQIGFTYPGLAKILKTDDIIYADNGIFKFIVQKRRGKTYLLAQNTGVLLTKKSANLPNIYQKLDLDVLTDRDKLGIRIGLRHGVNLFAVSFVRNAQDITYVREQIELAIKELNLDLPQYSKPAIVTKIETLEAINNLDEVVAASDIVMVARGDLAIEAGLYKLPTYQVQITNACQKHKKPVIIATQLLQSMTRNPIPTRAEIIDVFYAVQSRADAIMLSEETAIGKYPTLVINTAKKILQNAEDLLMEQYLYHAPQYYTQWPSPDLPADFSLPAMSDQASLDIEDFTYNTALSAYFMYLQHKAHAKMFLVFTKTGKKAIFLSKLRPDIPVYALVPNRFQYNKLKGVFNVYPYIYKNVNYENVQNSHLEVAIKHLAQKRVVLPKQQIITVYTQTFLGKKSQIVRLINV